MKDNYKQLIIGINQFYTDRLFLRPFTLDDAEDIFEYAKDEETVKFLTWPAHKSLDDSINTIKDYYSNPGIYAIELKLEKKCIGAIDFRLEEQHNKAAFGYVLNRKYWNNGYMSEALYELMKFFFNNIELNRIEATYYVGNGASGKVMQKCGMKFEGRGLMEVRIKGIYFDVDHYAILRDDWIEMTKIGG